MKDEPPCFVDQIHRHKTKTKQLSLGHKHIYMTDTNQPSQAIPYLDNNNNHNDKLHVPSSAMTTGSNSRTVSSFETVFSASTATTHSSMNDDSPFASLVRNALNQQQQPTVVRSRKAVGGGGGAGAGGGEGTLLEARRRAEEKIARLRHSSRLKSDNDIVPLTQQQSYNPPQQHLLVGGVSLGRRGSSGSGGSGGGGSGSITTDPALAKKERGRELARRARQRRKVYMQTLESRLKELERASHTTTQQLHVLAVENSVLRNRTDQLSNQLRELSCENSQLRGHVSLLNSSAAAPPPRVDDAMCFTMHPIYDVNQVLSFPPNDLPPQN